MTIEEKIGKWIAEAIIDDKNFETYDPNPQLATVKGWIRDIIRRMKGRVE